MPLTCRRGDGIRLAHLHRDAPEQGEGMGDSSCAATVHPRDMTPSERSQTEEEPVSQSLEKLTR